MRSGTKKLALRIALASALTVAAMLVLSALAWSGIPDGEPIPVHWGIDGKPDRYSSKFEGLLTAPVITAIAGALLSLLPLFEKRKENLEKSAEPFSLVVFGILGFLLTVHALLIGTYLGFETAISITVPLMAGLLFIVLGLFMPRIRSNHFVGVRTPWTLKSEKSWEKTNRIAGVIMVAMGAGMVFSALFSSGVLLLATVFGGAVVLILFSLFYSYAVWKNDPDRL